MVRFLLMSSLPLFVSESVPVKPLLNSIVSPAKEFAMAARSVPAVNPSLRFKTILVAPLPTCDQIKPTATKPLAEIFCSRPINQLSWLNTTLGCVQALLPPEIALPSASASAPRLPLSWKWTLAVPVRIAPPPRLNSIRTVVRHTPPSRRAASRRVGPDP